ncbi:MAG: hypothetical protein PHT69_02025 [Bacteroidales bacterium]|nr:hypothetical protein [Bacteroidales bacterium]
MNNNTYTLWNGWKETPSEEYSNFSWKKLGIGIMTGGIGALYESSRDKKKAIAQEKQQIERETLIQNAIAAAQLKELQNKTNKQVTGTAQKSSSEIAAEKAKTKKIIIIAGSSIAGVLLLITIIKILRK